MISIAVWTSTFAVAAGISLALWHLRAIDSTSRPPQTAGIVHGIIGATGFGLLLLVLRGPTRGIETGVSSFGPLSAALFAGALLTGLFLLLRRNGILMAIHAGIAISGYVLLLAWNSLG